MQASGSNTRAKRGQSANRQGSARGRGSSRGATSSSTSLSNGNSPSGLENASNHQRGRGNNGVNINGRGRYKGGNNQVRFDNQSTTVKKENLPSVSSSTATMSAFTAAQSSPGEVYNPFVTAAKSDKPAPNPFPNPFSSIAPSPFSQSPPPEKSTPNPTSSIFGAPSAPPSNPFAFGAQTQTNGSSFGSQPTTSAFGRPSAAAPSASFGKAQLQVNGAGGSSFGSSSFPTHATTSTFGAQTKSRSSSPLLGVPSSTFGAPSKGTFPGPLSSPSLGNTSSTFGSKLVAPTAPRAGNAPTPFNTNGFASKTAPKATTNPSQDTSLRAASVSSPALASKIDRLLQKEGIVAPPWPSLNPSDPGQKNTIDAFWHTSKKYRAKVRASLIRAGLLDDPDKPKKLSEAIDFKGTCEEMCPEFEKITRIMEHDVREPEKAIGPDGRLSPSPPKMIKALARSAAGQDAPLPMDVRSPAALRRTLDYLLENVLGREDGRLRAVHGFLWDRTRAIRRDFVFQSSMSPTELGDQIYCLERITRFHVIALHQLSVEGVIAEGFSEQQEVEQLGKSLLSLIHAYEDCQAQGIPCDNEAEFRAYYVLFNSHNTGILETVQDWGWKFWGESEQIKIAVSLVETLQNTWDTRGPLKPQAATDIALNAYSRFFSVIEDKKVSYTMACFAEIHFNNVRKSALKAIYAAHRSQRRTKDWTLSKLNTYLRFDDEADIIPFAEAYGLHFDDASGEDHLSFEVDSTISDPFPPLPQRHSDSLVERKRGTRSLPEVIDSTVFELEDENRAGIQVKSALADVADNGQELFVKDRRVSTNPGTSILQTPVTTGGETSNIFDTKETTAGNDLPHPESSSKPGSLFDRISAPKTPAVDIFGQKPTGAAVSVLFNKETPRATSIFDKPETQPTPNELLSGANQPSSKPLFNFLQQPPVPTPAQTPAPPFTWGLTSSSAPPPKEPTRPSFDFGPPSAAAPPVLGTSPTDIVKTQFFPGSTTSTISQSQMGGQPENHDRQSDPRKDTSQQSLPQPPFATKSASIFNLTPQVQFESPKPSLTQPSNPPPAPLTTSSTSINSNAGVTKKVRLDGFSNWVVLGQDGLVDQFTEFMVDDVLRNAMEIFIKEEADRVAREAEEALRKETEEIRYAYLARKFCRKWRAITRQIWVRKKGKAARQARKDLAQSMRASKAAQAANLVEDFRISTTKKRDSLESLLSATGVLNGVHDQDGQLQAITSKDRRESGRRRQSSVQSSSTLNSSTGTHRRGNSENPLRRSILSDPSYLNGGSRIHLMSNYSARDEGRKQISGVQTDYFRLKARGITTLPDGTPLANTVARTTLNPKYPFDGTSKTETPKPSRRQEIPRSAPTYAGTSRGVPRNTAEREEDMRDLKTRAKAMMVEDKAARQSKPKRSLEGDDDELFERAKRVREQLDEGAGWYRKQIDRDSASRSMS